MLPDMENIEEIEKLITEFEENEQEKTKTFDIEDATDETVSFIDTEDSSILGIGKLGVLRLNTYKIQIKTSPITNISGMVDGLAALQQSIYLILNIEADQYIIYPYTYGVRILDLIGKPSHYVMAVIPERIEEALLGDDRITSISDFEFEVKDNKVAVKFIVHSIYGDIEEETVVIY